MALRWIEGFELYGTGTGASTQTALEAGLAAKWDSAYFGSPVYLGEGRVLGKCLHCQGNTGISLRKQFAETKTTWIVGFAMKGNTGNGDDILQILNALDLETNASGKIFVKRSSTTLGASGDAGTEPNVFSDDAWHYIELKVVIDSVAGSWELRVDGVESASGSQKEQPKDCSVRVTENFKLLESWIAELNGDLISLLPSSWLSTSPSAAIKTTHS